MNKNTPSSITMDTISKPLSISDETMTIFTLVVVAAVCQILAVIGVVANVINIMCFIKQGFKEPVNISLFGLAFADLGCLVTQFSLYVMYTLAVIAADDLLFNPKEVTYLVIDMPLLAFNRVNVWITVIITVERCLCITVPLKIKHIVTTKRMWILIACVYVVLIFSGSPVYAVNRLDQKFSPTKNRTLLGLVSTADKDKVEGIMYAINSFLLPFIAFIIIMICTAILVVNLRKRTRWMITSSTAANDCSSRRDQKVAKMVVMISVLFIVCFVPMAVSLLAMVFEPNINIGGSLEKIGDILGIIALLMVSINSSANIIIYHSMSRKYRETFQAVFCRERYNI